MLSEESDLVRLACLRHTANVRPEPESNSSKKRSFSFTVQFSKCDIINSIIQIKKIIREKMITNAFPNNNKKYK
tara:strand:- start:830 stop:1051 length:222 start_codon:yes stop_codon:yes gene_type:complete